MLWTKRAWRALLSSEQRAKLIRLHCQHGWTLSLRGNTPLHVSEVVYSFSREKSHSVWAFPTCDLGLWVECGGENELGTSIQSSLVSLYKVNVTSALGFHAMTSPMMYCTSDWAKVNPPFFRKVFCQTVRKVANTQSASFPTPTRSCNF